MRLPHGTALNRHVDVQSLRSRCFDERRHVERLERVAHDQAGGEHLVEARAGAWIEIEVHVIGPIDVVASRVPLVEIDTPQIDDPHQRGPILNHRKIDDSARAVLDVADLDPVRPRAGRPLHEEELPRRPVRIAFHDHGAVTKMRQQHCRDVRVVLQQIALRQAELLPEDLAQVRQPDLTLVDNQRDVILVARDSNGRGGHA